MAHLFGNQACVDPGLLAQSCAAANPPVPTDRWWGKAGAFTVPLGKEAGRGSVLLRASELARISPTADHALTFSGADAAHRVTLTPITFLHAECVTPGSATDPNAVYLCELVDRRYHLARVPIDRAYNLRETDGSAHLAATLNSGTPWTWQQIVTDLATVLGIGTLTLPFTPDATPESLSYFAPASAWAALCDVLDRLACAIEYNPEGNTFAIVRLGSADTTAATAQAALEGERLWDGYNFEAHRGDRPEKVNVIFTRLPVPTGGTSPVHVESVTLTATAGVVTGTAVQLLDDLVAQGATGTPSNSAALATRAAERAADWVRKSDGYERRLVRVYRDFQSPATLLGSTIGRAVLDDRGGPFSTTISAAPDGALEAWRGARAPRALTVEGDGGSPSYPGIHTARFGAAFTVTKPVAGRSNIELTSLPASVITTSLSSCAWTVWFKTTQCLKVELVAAIGRCAGATISDIYPYLSHDTGVWVSDDPDVLTHDTGTGPVTFTPGVEPAATADGVAGQYLGCDGSGRALFGFASGTLCDDAADPDCVSWIVLAFTCSCCSIEGWEGEGWYCVLVDPEGDCETDEQEVVELLEADRCDDEIVICSGPYATEAEALAVCGEPIDPPACVGHVFTNATMTFTGKTGSCTCLPDSVTRTGQGTDAASWQDASCGFTDIIMTLSCSGGVYVVAGNFLTTTELLYFSASPWTLVFRWTIPGAIPDICLGAGDVIVTITDPP